MKFNALQSKNFNATLSKLQLFWEIGEHPAVHAVAFGLGHVAALGHGFVDDHGFAEAAVLQIAEHPFVGGVIAGAGAAACMAGNAVFVDDAFDVAVVGLIDVAKVAFVAGIVFFAGSCPGGGNNSNQEGSRQEAESRSKGHKFEKVVEEGKRCFRAFWFCVVLGLFENIRQLRGKFKCRSNT